MNTKILHQLYEDEHPAVKTDLLVAIIAACSADKYGKIRDTQKEIAAVGGLTKATVNRSFHSLVGLGLLEQNGRGYRFATVDPRPDSVMSRHRLPDGNILLKPRNKSEKQEKRPQHTSQSLLEAERQRKLKEHNLKVEEAWLKADDRWKYLTETLGMKCSPPVLYAPDADGKISWKWPGKPDEQRILEAEAERANETRRRLLNPRRRRG